MVKKLLLSVAGLTLVLGVFAAPAVSLDPAPARVLLLNGLPGRVDICFGPTEVVSNLRYRRAVLFEEMPPGAYRFVIRIARAGDCTGRRLAVVTKTIAEDANDSLVIWRPFRKVLIKQFHNDVRLDSAEEPTVTVRHVARNPRFIDVWLWEHVREMKATVLEPTLDNQPRGGTSKPIPVRPGQFFIDIFPSKATRAFSWEGFWGVANPGTATEVYLIGTTRTNTTVVGYYQDGVVVGP